MLQLKSVRKRDSRRWECPAALYRRVEEYAPNGRLNYKWWKSGSGKRERQICYDTGGAISCFIKYDTIEYPHRERTTWYDSNGDMIRSMETLFDEFGNVVDERSEIL